MNKALSSLTLKIQTIVEEKILYCKFKTVVTEKVDLDSRFEAFKNRIQRTLQTKSKEEIELLREIKSQSKFLTFLATILQKISQGIYEEPLALLLQATENETQNTISFHLH